MTSPFVHVLLRPDDPKPYPMCSECVEFFIPGSEAGAVFTVTEVREMPHVLYRQCWSCSVVLVEHVSP